MDVRSAVLDGCVVCAPNCPAKLSSVVVRVSVLLPPVIALVIWAKSHELIFQGEGLLT